jgi:hypothetical protein
VVLPWVSQRLIAAASGSIAEDFEHSGGITGPAPSHGRVLTRTRLAVPELVGHCSGRLACIVHERRDCLAEDMARYPRVPAVLQRRSKIGLCVARIAQPTPWG